MITLHRCIGCHADQPRLLIDFGAQPPSNRFLHSVDDTEDRHPLLLCQCAGCGLVQLADPMTTDMVKSRFDWLTYNEPEGHLDRLADRITKLPDITKEALIFGLTYKDDSTLARLNRLGFGNAHRFDPMSDLDVSDQCAGLETVQAAITERLSTRLATRYGCADVLIARHILEHAHNPVSFLNALWQLIKPNGYLVFEVPNCSKFIEACDYSFIWEEHISYFTPTALKNFFAINNCRLVELLNFPYPLEDSLIAIVRRAGSGFEAKKVGGENLIAREIETAGEFASRFGEVKTAYKNCLSASRSAGNRIAIFGAGHLAAKFLNFYDLDDLIECVVDDSPDKQGLFMPGSRLPVIGSAVLADKNIHLCLLSLNPESEQKVLVKNKAFIEGGGEFYSIFALSPISLMLQQHAA